MSVTPDGADVEWWLSLYVVIVFECLYLVLDQQRDMWSRPGIPYNTVTKPGWISEKCEDWFNFCISFVPFCLKLGETKQLKLYCLDCKVTHSCLSNPHSTNGQRMLSCACGQCQALPNWLEGSSSVASWPSTLSQLGQVSRKYLISPMEPSDPKWPFKAFSLYVLRFRPPWTWQCLTSSGILTLVTWVFLPHV